MLHIEADNTIRLTRGDTARITISLEDDSGNGYEMQDTDELILSVKLNIRDEQYALQKTVTGSNMFYLKPEDTGKLAFKKYVYDVQLVTNGEVYTVIEPSTFEILKEVTVEWQ